MLQKTDKIFVIRFFFDKDIDRLIREFNQQNTGGNYRQQQEIISVVGICNLFTRPQFAPFLQNETRYRSFMLNNNNLHQVCSMPLRRFIVLRMSYSRIDSQHTEFLCHLQTHGNFLLALTSRVTKYRNFPNKFFKQNLLCFPSKPTFYYIMQQNWES